MALKSEKVVIAPIGVIESVHVEADKTPIQPVFARGVKGRAVVFPEYAEELDGIEEFTHIILIYHFHQAGPSALTVRPFLEDVEKGVFATRHPKRPSGLGLSMVRLTAREGNVLLLEDVDILDGTPLLDIKPWVAKFDRPFDAGSGWVDNVDEQTMKQRGRRNFAGNGGNSDSGEKS
ncbi:MAG: tRNA (N6-threonylcarbamoyladenosine(37)-N6)-methyltransferase TrmO [Deltaproteobacteria bacterium]|nr:tRNA (N6-threonylcarbamoyladenosine(37)-N6)-methyltransferase TrmO [Deltaproteobacteria bacterium]